MNSTTYIATLPINKQVSDLIDCMRQLSQIYGKACDYIGDINDNATDADAEIDSRIAQPFEDMRYALAELVGQAISDSLIVDGIPA